MVPNALIAAYGRCGRLVYVGRVFAGIRSKTVSSWNALIGAHAQNGEASAAIDLFIQMNNACGLKPDWFSIGSLLLACANLLHCKATHGFILRNGLEKDSFIRVSLLSVYIQCGRQSLARVLFDEAEENDEVSWNTMIAGYSQNGLPAEALQLFREMQSMGASGHWPSPMGWTRCAPALQGDAILWLDVAGKVYSFVAGENPLPGMDEVRTMWHGLEQRIREIGYTPDTTVVLHELEEEEKVEALRWHSEKQAIAFGLLRTARPTKSSKS
jgi:pentatricopeptide repeat protein